MWLCCANSDRWCHLPHPVPWGCVTPSHSSPARALGWAAPLAGRVPLSCALPSTRGTWQGSPEPHGGQEGDILTPSQDVGCPGDEGSRGKQLRVKGLEEKRLFICR